jgi:chemotaxis protein MotB
MARFRREQRSHTDIWPGFVDALSTLLLVLIFVLVVFVLGQFFLNQLLAGKDTRLQELEANIAALAAELDLEQAAGAELRLSVTRLTGDLQAAQSDREDALGLLAEVEAERDEFRDQLFLIEDEQALLTQTLNEMRVEAARAEALEAELQQSIDLRGRLEEELALARETVAADQETIEAQLAQLVQLRRDIEALEQVRADLELEVVETSAMLEAARLARSDAVDEIARLADALEAARAEADRLEVTVTELSGVVDASEAETRTLEEELTRLTALLRTTEEERAASERQIEQLTARLEAAEGEGETVAIERDRLAVLLLAAQTESEQRAERIDTLAQQLEEARDLSGERERRVAELVALLEETRGTRDVTETTVEDLRAAREQLMAELTAVRDRSAELEARLSSEEERTALAQRQLEERDLRIEELLRSAGRTEEALATEQTLSREALNQVELLNRQVNALRVQLAALEQTLDLERDRIEEQQVTIADLGSKLNMALASRVEELSRFRSEFFGRLRQVLGDRPDVRIVGDRFVFQSEVLFPTASADIESGGREELRQLAATIREVMAELPTDVPWVLQVNGHTDRRPISTPEFPSNWELSTARAINVGKYLVSQGIPPERIAVAGFAHFQPLDDRQDEIAYRRNRRIEIKLTTG